jgi:hypothetical protein
MGLIIFSSNSAAYWAAVDVWSTRVAAFALYGVGFGIEFLRYPAGVQLAMC